MREETRRQRQEQIEQAAYAVLEEKGYGGTSMLAIARRARASNELESGGDPLETLDLLGPKLLALLTGVRAIALNRAAAADTSGELGAAISQNGRETVLPMIAAVLEKARAGGQLHFETTEEATELYLNLLVGDLQIRRAIGRAPVPTAADCNARAKRALDLLRHIFN